jgi:GNAT superfamily N-acetyltransferase
VSLDDETEGEVLYRPATEDDLAQTSRVYRAAVNELFARQNVPQLPETGAAELPGHRHLLRHDAPRFWVAELGGRVVGFGAGIVRGRWWYLSALFVLPEVQGRGVGRALLERAKAGHPAPGGVAATITDAVQPLSNTLYARCGLTPRLPLICFTGRLRTPATPAASPGCEIVPLSPGALPEVSRLDEAVLGFDRTPDHAYLLAKDGQRGWLLRHNGRPAGYVYTDSSGVIGPAASLRPAHMPLLMRHALAELAPLEPETVQAAVPGPNVQAQRILWQAGLVFENPSGLLLMSRPYGRFDRYVVGSYGLM